MKGFNALPRAFFFSTDYHEENLFRQCFVSMPYLGLSSFLPYKGGEGVSKNKTFQCPTSGFLLFYAMSLHPLNLLALQIRFCV